MKETIQKALSPQASIKDRRAAVELEAVSRKMRKQWDACPPERAEDAELEERMWTQIRLRCQEQKYLSLKRIWWGVAAACVVLLAVAGWWRQIGEIDTASPAWHEIHAENMQKVILPDSTGVWLAAGSTLRLEKSFKNKRNVWLTGEATFEIKRNAGQPFRVHLDNVFVEVKGTVFKALNRRGFPKEVDLFQGKVEFNMPEQGRVIPMAPRQCLSYNEHTGTTAIAYLGPVSWKDGKYFFNDISLECVIRIINHIYHIHLIPDTNIDVTEKIRGDIRMDEPLQEVLDKLSYALGKSYKRMENNKYLLY